MHLVHRGSFNADIQGLEFQDMPASLSICREKVKVVARDTERRGETRGPNANESPRDLFEVKLCLSGSSRFQAGTPGNRLHNPGFNKGELALDQEGVEHIAGAPKLIANGKQSVEALK